MPKQFLTLKKIRLCKNKRYAGRKYTEHACDLPLYPDNCTSRAYGVEIELPCARDDDDDHVYASTWRKLDALPIDRKEDGSLGSYDLEFVFPPMSRRQWRDSGIFDKFVSIYSEDLRTARTARFYGTHIHANAGHWMLPEALLVKPLVMDNWDFFCWVAGRVPYDRRCLQRSSLDNMVVNSEREIAGITGYSTIEYRIFDATTDKNLLLSWMELLDCIEEYVRHPRVMKAFNSSSFAAAYGQATTTLTEYQRIGYRYNRIINCAVHYLYGAELSQSSAFRDYLKSKRVAKRYPTVHAAYSKYLSFNGGTEFNGVFSYKYFLNQFLDSGASTNASPVPSSPQLVAA